MSNLVIIYSAIAVCLIFLFLVILFIVQQSKMNKKLEEMTNSRDSLLYKLGTVEVSLRKYENKECLEKEEKDLKQKEIKKLQNTISRLVGERDYYYKLSNQKNSSNEYEELYKSTLNELKQTKELYNSVSNTLKQTKDENCLLSKQLPINNDTKQVTYNNSFNHNQSYYRQNYSNQFKPLVYNIDFQMHYVPKELFKKFLSDNLFIKNHYDTANDFSYRLQNKKIIIERAHLRNGSCSKGVISLGNFYEFGNSEMWARYVRRGDSHVKINELLVIDFNTIMKNYYNS